MSRGHSWKSFKVPRLLHILKWMVRWQDQTSTDSAPCLYSLILSIAGQGARARTNGVFILRCTFLDLECACNGIWKLHLPLLDWWPWWPSPNIDTCLIISCKIGAFYACRKVLHRKHTRHTRHIRHPKMAHVRALGNPRMVHPGQI